MIVPSFARIITGMRSVTRPSMPQGRHAIAHEFKNLGFPARLRPIRDDTNNARHRILQFIIAAPCDSTKSFAEV